MRHWEEILPFEDGEALAQVSLRSYGCHISGSVSGQIEWGSEHPASWPWQQMREFLRYFQTQPTL